MDKKPSYSLIPNYNIPIIYNATSHLALAKLNKHFIRHLLGIVRINHYFLKDIVAGYI